MKLYNIDEYMIAAKNMIKYGSDFEKLLGKALLVANEIEMKKISNGFTKQFVFYLNREEILRKKSLRQKYEDYLNHKYSLNEVLELIDFYLKAKRFNSGYKKEILRYGNLRMYGTILRKFDKQKFNLCFKNWKDDN